jgi:putative transposase
MTEHTIAREVTRAWPRPEEPLPDDLWVLLEPHIPIHHVEHPLGCYKQRISARIVLRAILHQLITGCQWNSIRASEMGCSGRTANRRYHEWVEEGVFTCFWEAGLKACQAFQTLDTEWVSIDGCLTKSPMCIEDAGPNPTDRAKKGTKKSLLVDANGIPIGLFVCPANQSEFKTFAQVWHDAFSKVCLEGSHVCLDKGFDARWVRDAIRLFDAHPHVRARGEEIRELAEAQHPRRWVVERTFSWLHGYRALRIRWMRSSKGYRGQLELACGIVTWRALFNSNERPN